MRGYFTTLSQLKVRIYLLYSLLMFRLYLRMLVLGLVMMLRSGNEEEWDKYEVIYIIFSGYPFNLT